MIPKMSRQTAWVLFNLYARDGYSVDLLELKGELIKAAQMVGLLPK